MIIQHNMAAINAMTQLGITGTNLSKSMERLSSGYRVNRASDDAATLAISEKKRAQVRGLIRAARNAEEGVDFVRTGDGAMNEMESLLQRMRELAVQSLNDAVNTPEDQEKMQMEFDALQSEIDRINDQTEFNKKLVFEHYADTYSAFNGNRVWSQDQLHVIDSAHQSLEVTYKTEPDGAEKSITLTIPEGTYTTQELMDEMDDILTSLGDAADGLYLEYTDDNTCNMVLENGVEITDISGGLSYLFTDEYGGNTFGSLIGTTIFNEGYPLTISDENNELKFTIEYFDGGTRDVEIHMRPGAYTRQDIIDYLNRELAGTGMAASEYGDYSIKVGGEDGIITGLKGNMFKIDEGDHAMTSVFYDNTKYGSVEKTSAQFTGGAVLVNRSGDTECNKFTIDDSNHILRLRVGKDPAAPFIEISLEKRDYTMSEMIAELQNKFDAAGIEATVQSFEQSGAVTPNGNYYRFYGIRITSKEQGDDMKIEFDRAGSTAYDTLFVKRTYTDEGRNVETTAGRDEYTSPVLTGGKITGTDNIPAVLTSANNSFSLRLEETNADGTKTTGSYTIRLTEKTYSSIDELLEEINNQIARGPVGISGKIKAVNAGGAISFRASDGNRSVTSIRFAETSSGGYQSLFVGTYTAYEWNDATSSGNPPKVSLDKLSDPVVIGDDNDQFSVNVGGQNRTVDIPHGTYTPDDFAAKLTELLKGKESTSTTTYDGNGTGTSRSTASSHSATGGTRSLGSINCNVKGTGEGKQGETAVEQATPASYTVPVNLKSSISVDDSNNHFRITINGTEYDITLDNRTYTPAQLAEEFQKKLNAATTNADRVDVTLKDNRLVFTTQSKGAAASLQFSASTSSFMESIRKEETAATLTVSGHPLQSPITINSSNNIFSMKVNGNSYAVSLDAGTYTSPASFAAMLERKLRERGAGVSVSLSGNNLKFTTQETGSAASIELDTGNCGNAASAIFGDQTEKTAASATLRPSLPGASSGAIKENEQGNFMLSITEGGVTKTVDLTVPPKEKGYTNAELRDALNQLLREKGVRASVSLSGSSLTFTSTGKGADVSLNVSGSMTRKTKTPDIEASIDPRTGNLVLTNTSNGASVSVSPSQDSPVLQPTPVTKRNNPSSPTEGRIVKERYTMRSNRSIHIPDGMTITDHNKQFKFSYLYPGGMKEVEFELPEGEYHYAQLKDALQQKIDAVLGAGELSVDVTSSGITFTAGHYGEYSLANASGGFYEYVMQGKAVRGSDEKTYEQSGRQVVKDAYIAGRKDIRNNTCNIVKNYSDEMSIDVTIGGTVHTLKFKLSPGEYSCDDLIREIQAKVDEQVKAAGLPEHMILVGRGVYDTGVSGADDKNSLFFYLNKGIDLEPGEYRLDGLRGNALFEVFYKTEGSIVPAYITGSKDISEGVEILPGNDTFSVEVDGVTYQYQIPAGTYTCEEFLEKMNEILDDPDCLLDVTLSGNNLKFSHEKLGEHEISGIHGPAKASFMYEISGRTDYDSGLWLQIGANSGQGMEVQRYSLSSMSMKINSITISKSKYAGKALGRLDHAMGYLNEVRSSYGSVQNRLEYTIKGNENTAENTQASESKDRDADMAEEMVQYSKSQLLQQTDTVILAQANQQTQDVLALLR